jgi:predicted ATPase
LWARLNEAGELVSGSHVVSTTGSPGDYEVTFDRDISKCAAVATLNGEGLQQVVTAAVTTGSNAVSVFVVNRANGTGATARVSLAVFCP